MKDKIVKKHLSDKGFYEGDMVTFGVENQISGGYIGPTWGVLFMGGHSEESYILCRDVSSGKEFKMTINKGCDAYLGTIKKITDEEAIQLGVKDRVKKYGYDFLRFIEDRVFKVSK